MESSYNRRRRDYKNTNDDDEWASKDTGTLLLLLLLRLFLGGLLLLHASSTDPSWYEILRQRAHISFDPPRFVFLLKRFSRSIFRFFFNFFLRKLCARRWPFFVYYMANPLKNEKGFFQSFPEFLLYTYVLLSFRWSFFFCLVEK